MKKIFYLLLFLLTISACGKKGDPVYKTLNESKINSDVTLNSQKKI